MNETEKDNIVILATKIIVEIQVHINKCKKLHNKDPFSEENRSELHNKLFIMLFYFIRNLQDK